MAKHSLKIEIECELEELKKKYPKRTFKLFINEDASNWLCIGAIDWKGFDPDPKTELDYGRIAVYVVEKVEVETKVKTKKFEVHYHRCDADIDDIRYFKDLEELSDWFMRQNTLEKTVITKIV